MLVGWGCLGARPLLAAAPVPHFTSPEPSPYVATEGKAALVWQLEDLEDGARRFELQESRQPDFDDARTRYEGLDRATYVSGLPGGDFYYRVRVVSDGDAPGAWSDAMHVRVEYVSFKVVLWLVGTGVVVFVATVFTVLTGHGRAVRAEAVEP